MSLAASTAGLRKKTSPSPLARAEGNARPASAASSARSRLPTIAIVSAALAASLVATVGCHGSDDDDVTAERHVRRPARPAERDPNAVPTGSVVTIASTAPTPVPTPVPIPLGGAAPPVIPPIPVPTTKATITKSLPSVGVPAPHAMPGGAKAVVPTT